MDPLLPCPNCGSPVRADAARCEVCGARTMAEPPPRWRVRAVVGVFGALFLAAAVWGVGWAKGQWSGSPTAAGTTSASSANPSSSVPVGSPVTSPATPKGSSTPSLPGGARLCDQGGDLRVYAGSQQTSCAFAITVRDAYVGAGGLGGDSSRQVRAHSTVTDKTYMITCAGRAPVTCHGGNDAVIYLLP